MKPTILHTDGEGPLVRIDLAANITSRLDFDNGTRKIPGRDFFGLLSFYDDYLTEIGTEGYQAGDTLALVVPHFLAHEVTDDDVLAEAKKTELSPGVEEYIVGLHADGWEVNVISTAYRPMWDLVGNYLNIPKSHIACTELDLTNLRKIFGSYFNEFVIRQEKGITNLLPIAETAMQRVDKGEGVVSVFQDEEFNQLKQTLDGFYFRDLPRFFGYRPLEAVHVMGGKRKVEAAKEFALKQGVPLRDIPYVGDSITDDAMNSHLKAEDGFPIAINGNRYALRNARASVATREDVGTVRPLLDNWQQGGIEQVKLFVQGKHESSMGYGKEREIQHEVLGETRYWVREGEPGQDEIAVHKEARSHIRGVAAVLG